MAYNMKGHELPGPNQKQSPLKSSRTGAEANKAIKVQGLKNVGMAGLTMLALPMNIAKGVQMQQDTSAKTPSKKKSPLNKFGDGGMLSTGRERDPETGKKRNPPGDKIGKGMTHYKQSLGMVLGASALMSPYFRKLGSKAEIG